MQGREIQIIFPPNYTAQNEFHERKNNLNSSSVFLRERTLGESVQASSWKEHRNHGIVSPQWERLLCALKMPSEYTNSWAFLTPWSFRNSHHLATDAPGLHNNSAKVPSIRLSRPVANSLSSCSLTFASSLKLFSLRDGWWHWILLVQPLPFRPCPPLFLYWLFSLSFPWIKGIL